MMSLNLLKINEQNSLRAQKDLLIIVNCKVRDLTQRKRGEMDAANKNDGGKSNSPLSQ